MRTILIDILFTVHTLASCLVLCAFMVSPWIWQESRLWAILAIIGGLVTMATQAKTTAWYRKELDF
jgi:hypothetical protein